MRFFVLAGIICWYVGVRTIIYYYFIGGPRGGSMDFYDWWWTWLIALPATFLSLVLIGGIIAFLRG